MLKTIYLSIFLLLSLNLFSQSKSEDTSSNAEYDELKAIVDKDKSIKYQTGLVNLSDEVELNIPKGYKFMQKQDAEYVVYEFWGNPKSIDVLGLIVNENFSLLNSNNWSFVVSYDNSGYVKDEDADKIDYNEMMNEIHESEVEENKERKKEGFPSIHIIGWAAKPYYDKSTNVLHWAKSIKFGSIEDTTLNYDVRILGRKGLLSLNAVGTIDQLSDIQSHIPEIVKIAKFKEGNKYSDFNPSIDKVAAYTIGGLVAGKLLAKAGILALLLKNIKLVLLGTVALFAALKNKISNLFGNKSNDDNTVS